MPSVVKRPKIQHGEDRAVNDTQKALQQVADAINNSPLRFPHLVHFCVPCFSPSWVALGNTLVRAPVYHAREPGTLLAAAFTSFANMAASGVDFRQFYLERARGGVYSTLMANVTTVATGMTANVPLELALAAGPQDLDIAEGDIIVLTIGGGGSFPVLNAGLFELYVQKEAQ